MRRVEIDDTLLAVGLLLALWLGTCLLVWGDRMGGAPQPCLPEEHMLWQRGSCP